MNYVGIFFFIFCFVFSNVTFAEYPKCVRYFSVSTFQNQEVISKTSIVTFRGFIATSQIPVYLKIERPIKEPNRWVILIHGLLDSHRAWNDMVPYFLKQGIGVVRLDLHGHGKTFFKQYESTLSSHSEHFKVPYEIDYRENVDLVVEILKYLEKFGVHKPTLIGHSMGGAIALAASQKVAEISSKVILIAPYVYRLERRALEKTFSIFFWGFNSFFFDLMPAFYRDFVERWMMDYFSDPVMYEHYQKFATEKVLEANAHLTPEQIKKVIRYHIKSGIATTKGLRDFDGVRLARNMDSNKDFLILIGSKDELLDLALEQKLADALPRANLQIIEDAGHMLINDRPAELVEQIRDFLDD